MTPLLIRGTKRVSFGARIQRISESLFGRAYGSTISTTAISPKVDFARYGGLPEKVAIGWAGAHFRTPDMAMPYCQRPEEPARSLLS
jgi:hypothetical protein